MDLMDIYRPLYPNITIDIYWPLYLNITKYSFFSEAHGIFPQDV